MRFVRLAGALALLLTSAACLSVDHFPGEPSRYDGLFFAAEADAPLAPALQEEQWRNYAIFGLVPWKQEQTEFAGKRLAQVGAEQRPMKVVVHTEQSFVNGLASFGLSLIGGILAPLLFVPRTTAVTGWIEG